MTSTKNSLGKIVPVLFGFFVMGFVDVVGISTSYIKNDFALSETLAGLIPSALFLWFLLLSVPTALLANRIGRKTTVQISNVVTIVGMLVPFAAYNFTTCMIAFALLGIGNTMLQVSLNPLLTNVVKGDALASSMTTGQLIKAISSFCGPFIALLAITLTGKWQFIFPVFGVVTLLSALWLSATHIDEEKGEDKGAGVGATFALLGNNVVLLCFIGIIAVVGLDVGMNIVTPKLLMERCGTDIAQAGLGSSVYFLCRTCGALVGAILLAKVASKTYFRWNMIAVAVAMAVLFTASGEVLILSMVGAIGFFASSIFSVIFAIALGGMQNKANEVSGLMITGVVGGALVSPLMGIAADSVGNQSGSLLVISICIAYLIICSFIIKTAK